MTGITIGPASDQGEVSSPIETSLALYKQCAIWEPNGRTTPILLTSNGNLDVAPNDTNALQAATARMPVCWVFSDRDLFDRIDPTSKQNSSIEQTVFEPIFEQAKSLINYLEGNNDLTMNRSTNNVRLADVQYETINMVPKDRPIIYRDRMEIIVAFDTLFKATAENELQYRIQDLFDLERAIARPVPIGYGFFESKGDDMVLVRRPNNFIRVGPRTCVRIDAMHLDMPNNEARRQALYIYLVAYALHRFMNGTTGCRLPKDARAADPEKESEGERGRWSIHDYAALATMLISGLTGYGDTPLTKTWTATDIQTTLDHIFGIGYSISNRLLWDATPTNIGNYYLLCLFVGFAMSRIKPTTMDYAVMKYINQDRLVTARLNDVNHGNFPSIGSVTGLMLLMPRNDLKWKGRSMFPFPVLVDMSGFTPETAMQRANMYEALRTPARVQSFSPVLIDRGEMPSNTIDHKSISEKWMSFRTTNDARVVIERLEMRDVIKYKFPRWGIMRNGIADSFKRFLFVVGLFTGGERTLKDGFITDVSMQILRPIRVTQYRTSMLETATQKEDSDAKHNVKEGILQTAKDGAGLTTPIIYNDEKDLSGKAVRSDLKQPPTRPLIPEKDHKDELGGEPPVSAKKSDSEE
jgi:hypothetical protein